MRNRALIMLLLAAILGMGAVYLARGWITRQTQPVVVKEEKVPLTTLVVANTTLYFGDRIGREHVRQVDWPANSVPPGSFRTLDSFFASKEPRVVLRRIDIGEPILAAKVTGEGNRATLSALISGDMRAMTVRVNDVIGVAGFVLPGDHVDVLLTREVQESKPITDILLQNIKVLGVDQVADDQQDKPKVVKAVTLEVTPEQSQKLALAVDVGKLALALRGETDTAPVSERTIRISDLGGGEFNAPKTAKIAEKVVEKVVYRQAPRRTRSPTITVTRGLKTSHYNVDNEGVASQPASKSLKNVKKPASASQNEEETSRDGPGPQAPGDPIALQPKSPPSAGTGR